MNSLKYARKDNEQLVVSIGLRAEKDGYLLSYKDNGFGFPDGHLSSREGGLGTYLLKSMSRQLNGTFSSRNNDGAESVVFFKEKNTK